MNCLPAIVSLFAASWLSAQPPNLVLNPGFEGLQAWEESGSAQKASQRESQWPKTTLKLAD